MRRLHAVLVGIFIATMSLVARAATVATGSDVSSVDFGPAGVDVDYKLKQSQGRETGTTYPAGTTSSARGGDWVTTTYSDYCGNVANGIPCLNSAGMSSASTLPPPLTVKTVTATNTTTRTQTNSYTFTGTGYIWAPATTTSTSTVTGTAIQNVTVTSTGTQLGLGVSDTNPTAKVSIKQDVANFPALTVQGGPGALANVQQWKDSSGNLIAMVRPDGTIIAGSSLGGVGSVGLSGRYGAKTVELDGYPTHVMLGNGQLIEDDGSAGILEDSTQAIALSADRGPTYYGTGFISLKTRGIHRMFIQNGGNVCIGSIDCATPFAVNSAKTFTVDSTGSAGMPSLRLNGSTSGTVTIKPASAAGTWSLTLPATAGSAGQVLQTNGSGVTTWAAVSTATSTFSATNVAAKVTVNSGLVTATSALTAADIGALAGNGYTVSGANLVSGATNGQITSARAMTSGDVTGALGYTPEVSGAAATAVNSAISGTTGGVAYFTGPHSIASSFPLNTTPTPTVVPVSDGSGTLNAWGLNTAVNGTSGWVPSFTGTHSIGAGWQVSGTPTPYYIPVSNSAGNLDAWVTHASNDALKGTGAIGNTDYTRTDDGGGVPVLIVTTGAITTSSNPIVTLSVSGYADGPIVCAIFIEVDGSAVSHGGSAFQLQSTEVWIQPIALPLTVSAGSHYLGGKLQAVSGSGIGGFWSQTVTLPLTVSAGSHYFGGQLQAVSGSGIGNTCRVYANSNSPYEHANIAVLAN